MIHAGWILHCVAHSFRVPVVGYILDGAITSHAAFLAVKHATYPGTIDLLTYLISPLPHLTPPQDLMYSLQMTLMLGHLLAAWECKVPFPPRWCPLDIDRYLALWRHRVSQIHLYSSHRTFSRSENARETASPTPTHCIVNQETVSRSVHVNVISFSWNYQLLQPKVYPTSRSQKGKTPPQSLN